MALRIERSRRQGFTIFALSGRVDQEYITELERLFGPRTHYTSIIVDLTEVRQADRVAVRFLARCEGGGITLENCPAYIREWITREKAQFGEHKNMGDEYD